MARARGACVGCIEIEPGAKCPTCGREKYNHPADNVRQRYRLVLHADVIDPDTGKNIPLCILDGAVEVDVIAYSPRAAAATLSNVLSELVKKHQQTGKVGP